MDKLKNIKISPDKKYLVLSKSTTFLEKVKHIVSSKLNIDDIYDTKSHKNSMIFETIILKDGGFIKFFLYNNGNLIKCSYDYVLVDSMLYAEDYSLIRSRCLMADIIAVTELEDLEDIGFSSTLDIIDPLKFKVRHRKFSHKNFADYGNCPNCGATVYDYDPVCPLCDSVLDWDLDKEAVIQSCIKYGEYNDALGTNLMNCDENWYNPYYALLQSFSIEDLSEMDEKEIVDLLRLAKSITTGLY